MGALLAMLAAGGCLRPPAAGPLPEVSAPREAHAYMGPLLHLHPLWPVLVQMQRRIADLSAWALPDELTRPPQHLDFSLLPPALELAPAPAAQIAILGIRRPEPVRTLPPDIQVSLEWKKQQVMRRWQRAVAIARAHQQAELARLEADLWRQVQVALNNLAIQEAMGGPGAADARQMREQIESNIERKLAAARRQAELKLAKQLAELQQERDAQIAQLEREALEAARQRRVPLLELPTDKLRWLEEKTKISWPDIGPERDIGNAERRALAELSARRQEAAQEVAQGLQAARAAQVTRLRRAAADLRRLIRQDVEAQARSQALLRGIVLHVPPLEEPTGEDITAQCAQWLKKLWHTSNPAG